MNDRKGKHLTEFREKGTPSSGRRRFKTAKQSKRIIKKTSSLSPPLKLTLSPAALSPSLLPLSSDSPIGLPLHLRATIEGERRNMGKDLALKKPKLEPLPVNEEEEEEETGAICNGRGGADMGRREQEEALLALIEHRTKEVDHLRRRVSYYCSQLNEAESRLRDSESKLARIRGEANSLSSKSFLKNGVKNIKVEHETTSHVHVNEGSSHNQLISKPVLLIPAAKPKVFQPIKLVDCGMEALNCSSDEDDVSVSAISNDVGKFKEKTSPSVSSEREATENRDKGTKRKLEQKEEKELIPLVRNSTSPSMIQYTSSHISSQHKRKLRSLAVCPVDDQLFVTSALDGVVNLWQIEARGSGACLLSANDCLSQKQRRWPEDIAWHPKGNSLVSVYSADGGDSQISVLSLNKTCDGPRVTFLEDKPHSKGIINSIIFTPWADACFVTGGSDHAVICWSETDGEKLWKPNALHRNLHSSAVMGVAGMQQNHFVMSAGADKRIFGFDVVAGRPSFKHQIESKCMSILPNPCDLNLFMVQTGTPERQLRLFDIRCRQEEIHEFGWKQESSGSQSALINQAWSPDGLYLTSGSADPVIHIFDIRFNAHKPSQSIKAHQKRVFKAVWHCSLPLLISISSDLSIGLHKIT